MSIVIQEISEQEYGAFLETYPLGSVFHQIPWLNAVREAYGVKTIFLGVFRSGKLTGALPVFIRKFVFLRLYGAPLPGLATPVALPPPVPSECGDELFRALGEWLEHRRLAHFQITWQGPKPPVPAPVLIEPRDNLEIDLTQRTLEALCKGIKTEARNRIRHAVREGVKVHWVQDREAVRIYRELIDSTYTRQGIPPNFPPRFYETLYHGMIGRGLRILGATHHGKTVAALWILHDAHKCYFWDGASIQERRQLASNHLLHWEVLRWASRKHMKTYDMIGRSTESGRAGARPGIGRFKRSFGAKPVDYWVITWQAPWMRTCLRLYRYLLRQRNQPKKGS